MAPASSANFLGPRLGFWKENIFMPIYLGTPAEPVAMDHDLISDPKVVISRFVVGLINDPDRIDMESFRFNTEHTLLNILNDAAEESGHGIEIKKMQIVPTESGTAYDPATVDVAAVGLDIMLTDELNIEPLPLIEASCPYYVQHARELPEGAIRIDNWILIPVEVEKKIPTGRSVLTHWLMNTKMK